MHSYLFRYAININLQEAVSIQPQLYRELLDAASKDSYERYTGQVLSAAT